jgi:microsomal dipeptidase-like Zn-dependent dipeptidase
MWRGVTRFSQSNFTALHQGKFRVVIAALNPIEKNFFTSKLGKGNLADWFYNFITMIGKKKIDFIQENKDYFLDLCAEYNFFKQLHDTVVTIYGEDMRYRLTSNFKDIVTNRKTPNVISVVLSIEGGNSFNTDNSQPPDNSVLLKIDDVKQWTHPPFFVSLCHHFYNYFGGHVRSLPSFLFTRPIRQEQKKHQDDDITQPGIKVIHRLLCKANGRRIYIDIKHMSRLVRIAYYRILENDYNTEQIPIIVSHGAVNGYPRLDDSDCPQRDRNGKFLGRDINFYDDEILRIAKSGGIFGLQIDDRVITNKCELRKIKFLCWNKNKKLMKRAGLVWNQIQYIADLLDKNGYYAWGTTALGTDFDGIVDPPDGYWTSAEIPKLYDNLIIHANNYLQHKTFNVPGNRVPANQIMDQIFSGNAMNFLSKYY